MKHKILLTSLVAMFMVGAAFATDDLSEGTFDPYNSTNHTSVTGACAEPPLDIDGSASNYTSTLYAIWNANTYTITLDNTTNGGSDGYAYVKEIYNTEWQNPSDQTITSTTIPTKSGSVFTGYFTASTNGTQDIPASGVLPSTTKYSANTTLYAQFAECVPSNFLTTIGAEAKHISGITATVSGNKCQYTVTCAAGFHAGQNENTTTYPINIASAGTIGTASDFTACNGNNITLTWDVQGGNANNPSNTGTNGSAHTCTYGGNITLPDKNPTKTGYTFGGWTTTQP